MHIICAPDSFKESIDAAAAAAAMAAGCRRAAPTARIDVCPLADGGDGTLAILLAALDARSETLRVTGPLGEPTEARLGLAPDGTAIVELAEASGLARVPSDRRDPMRATTFGTGELMARAVARRARRIICGVGGSATVDGGAGLCQALGATYLDMSGAPLPIPLPPTMLVRVGAIRRPADPPSIDVACDVTNPLLGPSGAAAVYGPQKGASPDDVAQLERGLSRLAAVAGLDPAIAGAGAAGGAAYGMAAVLGARLCRGVDLVMRAVGFDDRCRGASLVLTGEGRLDAQSRDGKVVSAVAAVAARHGAPVVAICGDAERDGEGWSDLLAGVVSLSERHGRARSLREPAGLVAEAAETIVRARLRA